MPYDDAYFAKYVRWGKTELGRALTRARVRFVKQFWTGPLIDVGSGGGTFVEAWPGAQGYDVNPASVAWLRERGLFRDPYAVRFDAACMWDCLEHIRDPGPLLANVRAWVFVSLPLFTDLAHVLRSKHYKKDEHCWYFTLRGLFHFMQIHGFDCVRSSSIETKLGREDIMSFAFLKGV